MNFPEFKDYPNITNKEQLKKLGKEDPLKIINLVEKVLGHDNTCWMRYTKRTRNPDVFTYDHSIEYKEDFDLITKSVCDCGCNTAIYVKETWTGDGYDTQLKTQLEYEELPNQPKPTKEQIKLQSDILLADIAEEKLGITHNQRTCSEIPVPKLVLNPNLSNSDQLQRLESHDY